MMNRKILVVIPTFNRLEVTRRCVTSILNGTYSKVDVIICDSDSSDGTRDALQGLSNISILNVGATAWWAAAVNRGVACALINNDYDYVLVLNDDVDIQRTLLEQLLNVTKEYPLRIISPAQISATGLFLGMMYSKWVKNFEVIYADKVKYPTEVHSTNGCCLLIPIEVFKAIGLFDEINCPQLAADVEFQIRARRAGFPTIACPDILITQHVNTNYHRKLNLKTLLTYEGSPVHLAAYLAHGRTLFNGPLNFAILGFRYHYRYVKGLLKAVFFCLKGA
jgi:GT2 family glycosyltransferase